MRRKLTTLALACSLLTSCYTTKRFAPLPVLARFNAKSGIRLEHPATPQREASRCAAQRVELEVTAVRGDTLFFSNARVLLQSPKAAVCAAGPGYVDIAAHPDLLAERLSINGALTWAGIAVAVPLAVVAILLFANPFAGGT